MTATQPITIDHPIGAKATILIDMSSFELFELCACRYNYSINLRRKPPAFNKNKALDLGGVFHEGLEAYYNGLKLGIDFNDRLNSAIKRIQLITSDPELSSLEPEEATGLISVISENLTFWRQEDESLVIHAVEEPFVYQLYSDDEVRILISGKIDLLVDKPGIGVNTASYTNLPIDHKTYSRDFPVKRLTNQFQNYALACSSPFLVVNRVGLQKTLKPHEKYKRVPLSYDEGILEQWKNNTINIILNNYLTCVATGVWPMNFTSCDKFNRLCEYFEVCDTSGEENKQWKLENNYVIGDVWDVTKKLEKLK